MSQPRYVIDEAGKRVAILLDIEEYEKLLREAKQQTLEIKPMTDEQKQKALQMIQRWKEEDQQLKPEQAEAEWELLKQYLEEDRPSYRKLFADEEKADEEPHE
jgi:hypothetical protein